jgi:transcriptional regulator with GAF, ATPase, and Fis domain
MKPAVVEVASELQALHAFDVELWREVGRHLELTETVRRLARVVRKVAPIDALCVRRVDSRPARLTTIAFGSAAALAEPDSARTELDPSAERALARFLNDRLPLVLTHAPAALVRALMPSGISGSAIAGPLVIGNQAQGVLIIIARDDRALGSAHENLVQRMLEPLSVALESDQRLHELAVMREALEADRRALLTRLGRQDVITDTVVGASSGLKLVMQRVDQVARTDAPVLLLGETGAGKELIARAIHVQSRRKDGPVVRVNCGAIPSELIDSELFGHEKGSFTGAVATRKGWFERADGGTLFLDEIGELPMAAQVRLLRVLQDGSLERVGGSQSVTVDVRIVAATHRNLETMVAEGIFREDLWYRISVFPIRLPPLRERDEDIPSLAAHFALKAGLRLGGMALVPSDHDIVLLRAYPWPGNVRELGAVIERAAILGDGKRLEIAKALGTHDGIVMPPAPAALRTPVPVAPVTPLSPLALPALTPLSTDATDRASLESLDLAMRSHIERALASTYGRIEGPFGAAKLLGINPHTLRARMRKLGIEWSRYRQREA